MITVSLKQFTKKPKAVLEQSQKNREPVHIKSRSNGFVMLLLEDYNSLMETLYLLGNEANANWLKESLRQADNGMLISWEEANLPHCHSGRTFPSA